MCLCSILFFFFYLYRDHGALHSFPTRRSSDLAGDRPVADARVRGRAVLREAAVEVLAGRGRHARGAADARRDRKSTRLNSSHLGISYAVFCLKKKKKKRNEHNEVVQQVEKVRV